MSGRFDAFVILAEMRTGSNHLEASLNALPDVESYGEVFNPVFVGSNNQTELFGIDITARDADPMPLLDAMLARPGLPGFRFFHDHDPRVVDRLLQDHRIAKVILSRNPLDSYVSLKIAQATGQWRLTNPKKAKTDKAVFDGAEFDARLAAQRAFRDRVQRALQVTGQTAFWIAYDDIGDLEVLNGLAAFLGTAHRLEDVPSKLKKQNPGDRESKVANADDMRAHLARLDPFLLSESVNLEPPRGPAVRRFLAAAQSPLLYLPVPGGPTDMVRDWLTALDGKAPQGGLTQKELRPWMRHRKGFWTFSVVRHPLARAYAALQEARSGSGPKPVTVRRLLTNHHGVDLDGDPADALLGFLRFLKANLGGQSALPVAARWASQSALLAGSAQAVLPQRLIREAEMQSELDALADKVGRPRPALKQPNYNELDALVSDEIEDACIDAYRRDYLTFGFKRWKAG